MEREALGLEKSLSIRTIQESLSCSQQTTTSSCRITGKLLKNVSLVYLEFACYVDKEIMMYHSREA